jgi:hypothetical protein
MHKELRPEQIEILVGSPAVNDEFSKKIKELDRRLKANSMSYRDWEILNDRQHDIFSSDMFLDGQCAASMREYVMGAVDSCWCPDVVEDLEHHSPVLIREIEKQQDMLPDIKVKIGENLNNLNDTIDLLLEQVIQEVSRKGVAHPDKVGKTMKNPATGESLTLVDFKHVLKEEGQDKEDLFNAVENILASAKPPIPITWISHDSSDKLRNNHGVGVIVVGQDSKGKSQAFIKFFNKSTMWKQIDFFRDTGWTIADTQSSRENLSFGPATLIKTEGQVSINKLGELVIQNATGNLPDVFVDSLPEHFKNLYAKSTPSALKFENNEQRSESLPSVRKYFGEIVAPLILGKDFMLEPKSVLGEAKENLLDPQGISDWSTATAVSYPTDPANPLVDSYLHFGDNLVGVSSKSGTGANPSVKNLYMMLFEEAAPEQLQRIRDDGFDDYVNLIETLNNNSQKMGPIRAAVEFGLLSERDANEAVQFLKDNPDLLEAQLSDRLNQLSAGHGLKLPNFGMTGGLGVMDLSKLIQERNRPSLVQKGKRGIWHLKYFNGVNEVEKNLKTTDKEEAASKVANAFGVVAGSGYRPANHLLAGIAKTLAAKINAEQLNGLTKITQFARRAYAFSNMVQIYGNYSPSGEADVQMDTFKIVYPPKFQGEIILNAGKGYTSTGQNDKMTVELKPT